MPIWIAGKVIATAVKSALVKNLIQLDLVGVVKGLGNQSKPTADYARKKGLFKSAGAHKLILVGPAEAGKTSFIKLLSGGLYADETQTVRTKNVKKFDKFIPVKIGEQELSVAALIDTPGQNSFETHIETIRDNAVGNLVIWCDHENFRSDDKARGLNWLKRFLVHLNSYFLNDEVKDPLTSILIVLNKKDLVTDEDRLQNERQAGEAVHDELGEALGDNISEIARVSCTLLKRENGEASVEEVARLLANIIKSKKPLYDSARKLAAA